MADEEHPEQESKEAGRPFKADLVRAVKLAVLLFGIIALAVVLAALLTDGLPDLPFDYEGKGLE